MGALYQLKKSKILPPEVFKQKKHYRRSILIFFND